MYINYVQNNDKVDLMSGNFPWKMTLENRINYSYYLLAILRFAINNISDNDNCDGNNDGNDDNDKNNNNVS